MRPSFSCPTMLGQVDKMSSPSSDDEKVFTLKFVLAGSPGVGKTRLARRIIRGQFKEPSLPTVGMEFGTRTLQYGDHSSIRAQVWDATEVIRYKSVSDAFYRGAVGAMVVYDISRRSTFDDLEMWLEHVRSHCHKSIAVVLVGNKSDMSSKQREVSMVEGMRFARRHGLDFLETSACDDTNVEEACRQLVMSVARYLPQEKACWASGNPSAYPLPKGWVRVMDRCYDHEDDDDGLESVTDVSSSPNVSSISNSGHKGSTDCASNTHHCNSRDSSDVDIENMDDDSDEDFDEHSGHGAGAAKPSSQHHSCDEAPKKGRVCIRYENIWTGQRVDQRPIYPVGPSEKCVVSNVPRPPDPSTYMEDPTKEQTSTKSEHGGLSLMRLTTTSSIWSFSSVSRSASGNPAGASGEGGEGTGGVECLSRYIESSE